MSVMSEAFYSCSDWSQLKMRAYAPPPPSKVFISMAPRSLHHARRVLQRRQPPASGRRREVRGTKALTAARLLGTGYLDQCDWSLRLIHHCASRSILRISNLC